MAFELTVEGYTFDNPPNKWRKSVNLGNTAVPHFRRFMASFYQSDSQELQFEVEGVLSLNESTDLDELEELQQIAIEGGEVTVDFDPFFSGECVIEDDPFEQADEHGRYRFIFTVNEETTDATEYPAHSTPTTGNTFEYGGFDFGFDPDSVEQNYERQTDTVDRLSGIARSVDNAGLVTRVRVEGVTDGDGQEQLWTKARNNAMAFLSAEWQNGWALLESLSVENDEETPHYTKGVYQYTAKFLIVKDPSTGIGQVSSFINHTIKDTGTYISDSDSGSADFDLLEFHVTDGTGSINDAFVIWHETTLTLTDNDVNYIYVTDSDSDGFGDVLVNQSGFPADAIKLWRVTTSGGIITKMVDVRAKLVNENDSDAGDSDSETSNGTLYYTVAGGTSPDDPNNQETTWDQTTVKLDFNATNYIFVEDPDSDGEGDVSVNQSGYPSNTVSLWRVTTDGDSITDETDDRPSDLTEPGSGDTTDSDLLFTDSLVLDDTALDFVEALVLSESFDVSDAVTWVGLATLSAETFDVSDGSPSWVGLFTFTEALNVEDGGSAGGSGFQLTTTATLNGNSISITVHEDTNQDGTSDNSETVNISDGTNTVTLNNLVGGAGNDYWLDITMTSDETSTPTLDSAQLDTDTGADQNPNTTWTIFGGLYDTSGNEYEGGGVVTKYGA